MAASKPILAVLTTPQPFPLSIYFGTLVGDLDSFPFAYGRYHPYTDCSIYIPNIRSLITLSTARCRHHVFSALPSGCSTRTLGLNLFRGEPAISEFDWNFTASHKSSAHVSGYVKSSAHVSGYVGSVLQFVLPNLQPAHG